MNKEQILTLKAALYCVAKTKFNFIMVDKEYIPKQTIIKRLVEILDKEEGSEQ